MERAGVFFSKGDNTRIAGKMQVHYRLKFDENGIPMMYVFNTCKHFIRTMPNLVYSSSNSEDIDTNCEDHIYDETRYMFMEYPIASKKAAYTPHPKAYDPLSD